MPGITIQPRDVLRLTRVTALTRPDLRLRAIDLDVAWGTAGVRLAGICAADVGHFEHHVCLPVFVPERDADIGSTVAYSALSAMVVWTCKSWVRQREGATYDQGGHI